MVIEKFCRLALGGVSFGLVVGFIITTVLLMFSKRNDAVNTTTQFTATVIAAYGSFYFGTHGHLHVSEVLATVTASVVLARSAWPLIINKEGLITFWKMLGFIAETMIFFLAGSIL